MQLTRMTDFALRLLVYVARHPQGLCTIAEVARAYGISETHLMKVTHQLGLHGWIETVRGKGGGMRLAHSPQEIRLGAVVRSVEPNFHLVECFASGSDCTLSGHCGLADIMEGALHSFLAHLDGFTLADALAGMDAKTGRDWKPLAWLAAGQPPGRPTSRRYVRP